MSLQEHKLTDYAVSIAGLPDKIENKAQWLKQQFDARTDSEVRDRHNSLIDALDKDLAGRPTNESMAGAIDEKVVELGAGDMAQGVYGQNGHVHSGGKPAGERGGQRVYHPDRHRGPGPGQRAADSERGKV